MPNPDVGRSGATESMPTELLDRVQEALHDVVIALLAVAPALEKPYPDDPRWTPWTRFIERPGEAAMQAHMDLREARKS